jgi:hypothetical protein
MGLDMYFKAKTYISNYDFTPVEKPTNALVKIAIGLSHYDDEKSSVEVSVNLGYWRKANQIHKWFVDNVQGGKDDCREAYVERMYMEKLRDQCKQALDNRDISFFPPQSGFFFGSTDIDEYYWSNIEYTKELMDKLLSDEKLKSFSFCYESSW